MLKSVRYPKIYRHKAAACLSISAAVILLFHGDFLVSVLSQARSQLPVQRRFIEFRHDIKEHGIECSACHNFPSKNWDRVRPKDDAFPDITDYPSHESCISCHRQQFFRGTRPPICTVCHTASTPRGGPRHPFPNPREIFDASPKGKTASSDFEIRFPHDKHVDIVSAAGAARSAFRFASFLRSGLNEESCAVCHKTLHPQTDPADEYVTKPPADLGDGFWLRRGTFKSVPIGHTTCFTCHSADTGLEPAPANCAACHKPRQPGPAADLDAALAKTMAITDRVTLDAWKRRDSSGKFVHDWAGHSDMSCDSCHSVQTMNTADFRTKRVAISSCSMCHVTGSTDEGGVLNLEVDARNANPAFQCTKCHIVFGGRAVPDSHHRALAEARGN